MADEFGLLDWTEAEGKWEGKGMERGERRRKRKDDHGAKEGISPFPGFRWWN